MSSNRPYISVIILAYNRKEYLLQAFKSAYHQTLSKNKYEIIVTKNFRDTKIDNYIEKHGGKLIFFEKGSYGEQLADAVKYAKGNVICFLEDDDMFDRNKLKFVYDIFARTPKLCYCHNGITYVDDKNRKINSEKYGNIGTDTLTENSPEVKLNELSKVPTFNSSSISIRKSVLLKNLPALRKINYGPDTFLFFIAVDSGLDIFATAKKLTRYRIHPSSSFPLGLGYEGFCRKQVQNSENFLKDFNIALDNAKREVTKRLITLNIDFMEITKYFYSGDRLGLLKAYLKYRKHSKEFEVKHRSINLVYLLAFLIWPNLVRYVYYKKITSLESRS